MAGYKEFKVEAERDDTTFKVLVKGWFSWKSGYVYTRYFAIEYETQQDALDAIERYKNRFIDA